MRIAANLTLLFTEVDFLSRFEAAAQAGFDGVECQFPYAFDAEQIRERLDRHGLPMVLFNLPAGDWARGERGIACHPDRVDEFRAGVAQAIDYARVLGVTQVNCLAGIRPEGVDEARIRETFVENLRYAAGMLEAVGIRLMMEMINTRDVPGFYLSSTQQALAIRESVGSGNLFLQYDVYHMHVMGEDLVRMIETNLEVIGHIQIADTPGRNEPGTGNITFTYLFSCLDGMGYEAWVSAEYHPLSTTQAGLTWVSNVRKKTRV
jgi:hydroxypyruvate isomerase